MANRIELDIANIDNIIKKNDLEEVTEATYFDKNREINQNGLFSTKIFGKTEYDRKRTFAYIDLGVRVITPNICKDLYRLDGKVKKIVNNVSGFIVNSEGELVEDDSGKTGISWFYKVFDKIKWKETDSNARKERLEKIRNFSKDEIFIDKYLVMPPFYRDINIHSSDDMISVDIVNDSFANLIRWSKSAKESSSTGFHGAADNTAANMQNELISLYDHLTDQPNIGKKKGIIKVGVLGKTTDYGARSVITAPTFGTFENELVDFEHCGLPLTMSLTTFFPFAIHWLTSYFRNELGYKNTYPVMIDGKEKEIELDNPMEKFTPDYFKKMIDKFINSPNERFEPIEIPTKREKPVHMYIRGRASKGDESPLMNRKATWTDIFYMCASDIVADKYVLLTRYPVEDHFGIFPIKVRVMSTIKTTPMYVGDKFYEHYPVVDLDIPYERVSIQFLDTLKISNLYLEGLGGDYDGDMLTIKGLWTKESIQNAKEIREKKSFLLNTGGFNMRTVSQEAIQVMYTLSKKV